MDTARTWLHKPELLSSKYFLISKIFFRPSAAAARSVGELWYDLGGVEPGVGDAPPCDAGTLSSVVFWL